jgi:hypothetical protein
MPIWEPSKKDLMRGKLVSEPAWFTCQIDSFDEGKLSKDKGSTNYNVEATIIRNAETGDEKDAGIVLVWNFNSKAMGFATGYMVALGVTPELGGRYRLEDSVGQILDIFVEHGEWDNKLVNRVNHKYRPATPKK